MPTGERGGLKSAFAGFNKPTDDEAERVLLGRTIGTAAATAAAAPEPAPAPYSYPVATSADPGALTPRPLRQREAVRQLSFRCPVSVAAELRRKAAFNQLEQQEIIVEGIRRVLSGLEAPPAGWDADQ